LAIRTGKECQKLNRRLDFVCNANRCRPERREPRKNRQFALLTWQVAPGTARKSCGSRRLYAPLGASSLEVPHVAYADRKFDSPSDKIEFYSSRSLAFQTGGEPRVRVQNASSSEVFPARRLYVEVRNGSFSRSNRRNDSQCSRQWPGLDARGHRVLVYGYRLRLTLIEQTPRRDRALARWIEHSQRAWR